MKWQRGAISTGDEIINCWYCPFCKQLALQKTDYCPNCGTDMQGQEEQIVTADMRGKEYGTE